MAYGWKRLARMHRAKQRAAERERWSDPLNADEWVRHANDFVRARWAELAKRIEESPAVAQANEGQSPPR